MKRTNLQERRMQFKMTQEQLAKQTNSTRTNISTIESGMCEPSFGLSIRIAKVLGVNCKEVEHLFKQKGK